MDWRHSDQLKEEVIRFAPGSAVRAGVSIYYNGKLAFDFSMDVSMGVPGVMWVDEDKLADSVAKTEDELGTLRFENTFLRQRIDGLLDTIVELQRSGSAGSVSAPSGSSSELS